MINSYGSYQRSPGLMELAMMERRGEITASQFVEFAAQRKRASKADNSKSQECFRADGSSYRIALMRNGKRTTCGGAKTQKKQAETPKAKTAAAGVKKEADRVKEAGSFKGAIGGFKSGKTYDVTPEMAAAAQKMGVSDLQLANGRVPKAVQADLIKEFDRLSAGGKPETGEKGGAIVPVKSALQKAQEETNERKGRTKTQEQRVEQFENIASNLIANLRADKEFLSTERSKVTAGDLRKISQDMLQKAEGKRDEFAQKKTPKSLIKDLEKDLKRIQKGNADYVKKYGALTDHLRDLEATYSKQLADAKANPKAAYDKKLSELDGMVSSAKKFLDEHDFEGKAASMNVEDDQQRSRVEAAVQKAQARLQRAWDALKSSNTSPSAAVASGMRELGVEPTGDIQADLKAAKSAFRKRAQETHPDLGGDPAEFRAVSESWDKIRSGQVAGGFLPEIDDFTMTRLKEQGINI